MSMVQGHSHGVRIEVQLKVEFVMAAKATAETNIHFTLP